MQTKTQLSMTNTSGATGSLSASDHHASYEGQTSRDRQGADVSRLSHRTERTCSRILPSTIDPGAPRSASTLNVRRSAFTLIELMVVIGIIAVLIAIVMPAIGNARKQARVAAVRATITVLDTGVEQFRADTSVGGSYPESTYRPVYVSPHTGTGDRFPVGGASLLAWALAGADLLGTPGFQDLDSDGHWWNNTGSDYSNAANNLYAIYPLGGAVPTALQGKPVHHRSGPFVDVSKMSFPKQVAPLTAQFALDELDVTPKPTLNSICFLDTFGQPILYYKANTAATLMAAQTYAAPGAIYSQRDNVNITGKPGTPGMDLGAGPIDTPGNLHYLGGDVGDTTFMPDLPNDNKTKSFARAIWNPNVTAVVRPQRADSYLLISAGPDGIFGNADDIANYEINK